MPLSRFGAAEPRAGRGRRFSFSVTTSTDLKAWMPPGGVISCPPALRERARARPRIIVDRNRYPGV